VFKVDLRFKMEKNLDIHCHSIRSWNLELNCIEVVCKFELAMFVMRCYYQPLHHPFDDKISEGVNQR
jgi:hypothetical protein